MSLNEPSNCPVCHGMMAPGHGHKSPWASLPLRKGDLICSECFYAIWCSVTRRIQIVVAGLRGCRDGVPSRNDRQLLAPDVEAIFRKVLGEQEGNS